MERKWGDNTLLKSIKNPVERPYEIGISCPEITFLGGDEKPDFGEIKIKMVPGEKLIELKSLKYYFYSFRDARMSYERFINVVFDDLTECYAPKQMVIELEFHPRGGISSTLRIDSTKIG